MCECACRGCMCVCTWYLCIRVIIFYLLPVQTNLLCVFFLDRLEVGSQIHGYFVLGAEERAKNGVGGHAHSAQSRPFELAPEIQHLDVQVFNLQFTKGVKGRDWMQEGE